MQLQWFLLWQSETVFLLAWHLWHPWREDHWSPQLVLLVASMM